MAVTFIAGGVAVATGGRDEVIPACAGKDGVLRLADGPGRCRSGERPVSWNREGPQGPAGERGPSGERGPRGPRGRTGPAGQLAVRVATPEVVSVGAQDVAVASLDAPAGTYLVTAVGDLSNAGPAPVDVACAWRPSTASFRARLDRGGATAPAFQAFSSTTTLRLAEDERIELSCDVEEGAKVLVQQVRLVAIPVGTVASPPE